MSLILVTPPVRQPITVAELRDYLKIGTDEDVKLAYLIKAATLKIENETKQKIVVQTWKQVYDDFPDVVKFELQPVRSITSVTYYDLDGSLISLDSTQYRKNLEANPAFLTYPYLTLFWPYTEFGRLSAVSVSYTVGYDSVNPSDPTAELAKPIPDDLRQAIFMTAAHFYSNPEPVMVGAGIVAVELPKSIDWLISPYRTWLF